MCEDLFVFLSFPFSIFPLIHNLSLFVYLVPLVQYVVSLAVTEALKEICDKNVSCSFNFLLSRVAEFEM